MALGGDAVEVAEERHPEDDDRVDGGLARMTVEARGHPTHEGEVDGRSHAPQEVVLGHARFETELVVQLADQCLPPHHLGNTPRFTGFRADYNTSACKPEDFGNSPCLVPR